MNDGMTLGQLIKALEAAPQDAWVQFDFGDTSPSGAHSYRGDYSMLAVGFDDSGAHPKVADFLGRLRRCDGDTFHGYKGGDYRMDGDTPLRVANWGKTSGTRIVGVDAVYDTRVVLRTAYDNEF